MAKLGSSRTPSGIKQTWRLWRHCCCRFGWYPLLVAPLVTASCLLDIYSSYGCEFIHVNVGFVPSNGAWNQSTATLGLFQFSATHNPDSITRSVMFQDMLTDGCIPYFNEFEVQFINGDRTWEVARVMSYISGVAGLVATGTSWLMVFTPLPAWLFWPGALLPALLVAFLCEGSKFLFLDTAICQSPLWYPSGIDSLPQQANSCVLGETSYFSIAAGGCFFLCLLMVCLKSPQKRELDESYGNNLGYIDGNEVDNGLDTSLEDDRHTDIELNKAQDSFTGIQKVSESAYGSSLDALSFENADGSNSLFEAVGEQFNPDLEAATSIERCESSSSLISEPTSVNSDKENCVDNSDTTPKDEVPQQDPEKALDEPSTPADAESVSSSTRVVSEARIAKAESLQNLAVLDEPSELIEKCVSDLEKAFRDEEQLKTSFA